VIFGYSLAIALALMVVKPLFYCGLFAIHGPFGTSILKCIFGAGFSGRTFDESAAKIEGGHGSWLAEVVCVSR
jgi:hypothetical protein